MTACFYQVKIDNMYPRRDEKFRFIDYINLVYYVDKNKIDEMIKYILIDYCGNSVMGYDNHSDKYWCKKNSRYSCDLHIEIEIIKKGYGYSRLKITPLVGNDTNIKYFIKKLHESIKLYETSKIIKYYIDNQNVL